MPSSSSADSGATGNVNNQVEREAEANGGGDMNLFFPEDSIDIGAEVVVGEEDAGDKISDEGLMYHGMRRRLSVDEVMRDRKRDKMEQKARRREHKKKAKRARAAQNVEESQGPGTQQQAPVVQAVDGQVPGAQVENLESEGEQDRGMEDVQEEQVSRELPPQEGQVDLDMVDHDPEQLGRIEELQGSMDGGEAQDALEVENQDPAEHVVLEQEDPEAHENGQASQENGRYLEEGEIVSESGEESDVDVGGPEDLPGYQHILDGLDASLPPPQGPIIIGVTRREPESYLQEQADLFVRYVVAHGLDGLNSQPSTSQAPMAPPVQPIRPIPYLANPSAVFQPNPYFNDLLLNVERHLLYQNFRYLTNLSAPMAPPQPTRPIAVYPNPIWSPFVPQFVPPVTNCAPPEVSPGTPFVAPQDEGFSMFAPGASTSAAQAQAQEEPMDLSGQEKEQESEVQNATGCRDVIVTSRNDITGQMANNQTGHSHIAFAMEQRPMFDGSGAFKRYQRSNVNPTQASRESYRGLERSTIGGNTTQVSGGSSDVREDSENSVDDEEIDIEVEEGQANPENAVEPQPRINEPQPQETAAEPTNPSEISKLDSSGAFIPGQGADKVNKAQGVNEGSENPESNVAIEEDEVRVAEDSGSRTKESRTEEPIENEKVGIEADKGQANPEDAVEPSLRINKPQPQETAPEPTNPRENPMVDGSGALVLHQGTNGVNEAQDVRESSRNSEADVAMEDGEAEAEEGQDNLRAVVEPSPRTDESRGPADEPTEVNKAQEIHGNSSGQEDSEEPEAADVAMEDDQEDEDSEESPDAERVVGGVARLSIHPNPESSDSANRNHQASEVNEAQDVNEGSGNREDSEELEDEEEMEEYDDDVEMEEDEEEVEEDSENEESPNPQSVFEGVAELSIHPNPGSPDSTSSHSSSSDDDEDRDQYDQEMMWHSDSATEEAEQIDDGLKKEVEEGQGESTYSGDVPTNKDFKMRRPMRDPGPASEDPDEVIDLTLPEEDSSSDESFGDDFVIIEQEVTTSTSPSQPIVSPAAEVVVQEAEKEDAANVQERQTADKVNKNQTCNQVAVATVSNSDKEKTPCPNPSFNLIQSVMEHAEEEVNHEEVARFSQEISQFEPSGESGEIVRGGEQEKEQSLNPEVADDAAQSETVGDSSEAHEEPQEVENQDRNVQMEVDEEVEAAVKVGPKQSTDDPNEGGYGEGHEDNAAPEEHHAAVSQPRIAQETDMDNGDDLDSDRVPENRGEELEVDKMVAPEKSNGDPNEAENEEGHESDLDQEEAHAAISEPRMNSDMDIEDGDNMDNMIDQMLDSEEATEDSGKAGIIAPSEASSAVQEQQKISETDVALAPQKSTESPEMVNADDMDTEEGTVTSDEGAEVVRLGEDDLAPEKSTKGTTEAGDEEAHKDDVAPQEAHADISEPRIAPESVTGHGDEMTSGEMMATSDVVVQHDEEREADISVAPENSTEEPVAAGVEGKNEDGVVPNNAPFAISEPMEVGPEEHDDEIDVDVVKAPEASTEDPKDTEDEQSKKNEVPKRHGEELDVNVGMAPEKSAEEHIEAVDENSHDDAMDLDEAAPAISESMEMVPEEHGELEDRVAVAPEKSTDDPSEAGDEETQKDDVNPEKGHTALSEPGKNPDMDMDHGDKIRLDEVSEDHGEEHDVDVAMAPEKSTSIPIEADVQEIHKEDVTPEEPTPVISSRLEPIRNSEEKKAKFSGEAKFAAPNKAPIETPEQRIVPKMDMDKGDKMSPGEAIVAYDEGAEVGRSGDLASKETTKDPEEVEDNTHENDVNQNEAPLVMENFVGSDEAVSAISEQRLVPVIDAPSASSADSEAHEEHQELINQTLNALVRVDRELEEDPTTISEPRMDPNTSIEYGDDMDFGEVPEDEIDYFYRYNMEPEEEENIDRSVTAAPENGIDSSQDQQLTPEDSIATTSTAVAPTTEAQEPTEDPEDSNPQESDTTNPEDTPNPEASQIPTTSSKRRKRASRSRRHVIKATVAEAPEPREDSEDIDPQETVTTNTEDVQEPESAQIPSRNSERPKRASRSRRRINKATVASTTETLEPRDDSEDLNPQDADPVANPEDVPNPEASQIPTTSSGRPKRASRSRRRGHKATAPVIVAGTSETPEPRENSEREIHLQEADPVANPEDVMEPESAQIPTTSSKRPKRASRSRRRGHKATAPVIVARTTGNSEPREDSERDINSRESEPEANPEDVQDPAASQIPTTSSEPPKRAFQSRRRVTKTTVARIAGAPEPREDSEDVNPQEPAPEDVPDSEPTIAKRPKRATRPRQEFHSPASNKASRPRKRKPRSSSQAPKAKKPTLCFHQPPPFVPEPEFVPKLEDIQEKMREVFEHCEATEVTEAEIAKFEGNMSSKKWDYRTKSKESRHMWVTISHGISLEPEFAKIEEERQKRRLEKRRQRWQLHGALFS